MRGLCAHNATTGTSYVAQRGGVLQVLCAAVDHEASFRPAADYRAHMNKLRPLARRTREPARCAKVHKGQPCYHRSLCKQHTPCPHVLVALPSLGTWQRQRLLFEVSGVAIFAPKLSCESLDSSTGLPSRSYLSVMSPLNWSCARRCK